MVKVRRDRVDASSEVHWHWQPKWTITQLQKNEQLHFSNKNNMKNVMSLLLIVEIAGGGGGGGRGDQSEKFLDLGTVTRPPSNIYARVNCSVTSDRCTRVQGHPRNLFRRPWIFGLSSLKHHTWPYHASVLWYTEENFSFQMQQWKFPRPYLRNDTMDFHF